MSKNKALIIILFAILLNIEIIIITNTKPGLIKKISNCHFVTETIPYKYMIEKGISHQTTSKILTSTTFISYYEKVLINSKNLDSSLIVKTANNISKELNNSKISPSKVKELINSLTTKEQIIKLNNYKNQNKLIKISRLTNKQNLKILFLILLIIVIIMYKLNNKKIYQEIIKSIKITNISLIIILSISLFFKIFYQNQQNIVYNILYETLNTFFIPIIKMIVINVFIMIFIKKIGSLKERVKKYENKYP